MRSKPTYAAAITRAVAILFLFTLTPATAQSELGTAQNFAVLGATTITNTGSSLVTGDLGLSPGSAITGFPPGIVTGTVHVNDGPAIQAQGDANTLYIDLVGRPCNADLSGQDLGGLTLGAGVYCYSSTAQLTGSLTLDAMGDPEAEFVFQIGSALTTASGASVLVINGGTECHVLWQVGSSATLGTGTSFIGTILASASVTLNTTTISGRAMALTGAVTMDSSSISLPPACQCTGPPAMVIDLGPACDPLTDAVLNATLPVVGGSTTLSVQSSTTPNSWLSLMVSLPPVTPASLGGCQFYVDVNGSAANFGLAYEALLDGSGNWAYAWPIPDSPAMVGTEYIIQAFVYAPTDPAAHFCYVFSNGLLLKLGCN